MRPLTLVTLLLLEGCAVQAAYQRGLAPDREHPGALSLSLRGLKGANHAPVAGARMTVTSGDDGWSIQNGALFAGYLWRPTQRWSFGAEFLGEAGLGEAHFREQRGTALYLGLSPSLFFRVAGVDTRRRAIHLGGVSVDLVLGLTGGAWLQERVAGRGCDGDCAFWEATAFAGLRLNVNSDPFAAPADPRSRDTHGSGL